jgi:hypothetical protein
MLPMGVVGFYTKQQKEKKSINTAHGSALDLANIKQL